MGKSIIEKNRHAERVSEKIMKIEISENLYEELRKYMDIYKLLQENQKQYYLLLNIRSNFHLRKNL
ncbi:MAG: hypothetical protein ABRQ37_14485 [Candidatus Eremiobacterota bacterium]